MVVKFSVLLNKNRIVVEVFTNIAPAKGDVDMSCNDAVENLKL